ncbi:MAG: dTDP-4-dehydrorhamnose reductase [Chlorobi bacterium]|nr:dTDP-4-dehydrorhamnose reductase [Chlorobiota bacterium]
MARIVITGAEGQLGQSLRVSAGRFSGHRFAYTDINDLDLTDTPITENFIRKIQPDYLINCAAYTAVDLAEEHRKAAFLLNRDVPANLALLAERYNFRLIHLSTDYVFDGKNHLPYTETDKPAPPSVYGQSKLAGEEALAGTSAMIIRTAWLYSEYGSNFVKTILKFAKEKNTLDVVYDQTGSPTYASDLALTILAIIDSIEQGENSYIPGIYHYADEGVCSWYDMAEEIIRYTGLTCRIQAVRTERFSRPAPRPAYSVLAKEKIKDNYHAEVPYWRESLQKCLTQLKSKDHGKQITH